jgi:hypothetical protein
MRKHLKTSTLVVLLLIPAQLAQAATCGFIQAPTSFSATIDQLRTKLSGPLTGTQPDEAQRVKCEGYLKTMSDALIKLEAAKQELPGSPPVAPAEIQKAQEALTVASGTFFREKCDEVVKSPDLSASLLRGTVDFARQQSNLHIGSLPFGPSSLVGGVVTDLLFNQIQRLLAPKRTNPYALIEDAAKMPIQASLLCTYYEAVTAIDENLSDEAIQERMGDIGNQRKTLEAQIAALRGRVAELDACIKNPGALGATNTEVALDPKFISTLTKIAASEDPATQCEMLVSLTVSKGDGLPDWKTATERVATQLCAGSDEERKSLPLAAQIACRKHAQLGETLAAMGGAGAEACDNKELIQKGVDAYNYLVSFYSKGTYLGLIPKRDASPDPWRAEMTQKQAELQAAIKSLEALPQLTGPNDEDLRAMNRLADNLDVRSLDVLSGRSRRDWLGRRSFDKSLLREHFSTMGRVLEKSEKSYYKDAEKELKRKDGKPDCEKIDNALRQLPGDQAYVTGGIQICDRFTSQPPSADPANPDSPPRQKPYEFRDKRFSFDNLDPALGKFCEERTRWLRSRQKQFGELQTRLREAKSQACGASK